MKNLAEDQSEILKNIYAKVTEMSNKKLQRTFFKTRQILQGWLLCVSNKDA